MLLAGLISETESKQRHGLPILDSIPGVSDAFSHQGTGQSRRADPVHPSDSHARRGRRACHRRGDAQQDERAVWSVAAIRWWSFPRRHADGVMDEPAIRAQGSAPRGSWPALSLILCTGGGEAFLPPRREGLWVPFWRP
ncbi:hypothetical protein ACKWRH_31150 [Bradyrhizobium sp. Pa8]|uniref:hypothetical protein n=1 Tax=Bradyrhizobium sp. Pa8 TaxID=3386552 RepID=UPI00403F3A4F